MFALEDIARTVGEKILGYKGHVYDTRHVHGHEESSIDIMAYEYMMGALEERMIKFPEEARFIGKYLFELHELQDIDVNKEKNRIIKGNLRIDEIDGTTNVKRCIASRFNYAPTAAVSLALCENQSLGSIVIGTIFDLQHRKVFSGMKVDDGYMAFYNREVLDPKDCAAMQGDTCTRIMIPGYSNNEQEKLGQFRQAIVNIDSKKKQYRIYDGCRSSAVDVLNIIRNQYDAYIDVRALLPDGGAMLFPYDIAGVIPIALGCGLEVSDVHGNPISSYEGKNDPLTLIVARKGLKDKFVEALRPLTEKKTPQTVTPS
jgi:fructose-1,6-bisphosphatase/inositol monophosphatase family enzyme